MTKNPERILFLYLPTGGGHISAAKALASEIQSRYPNGEVETFLLNGLSPTSQIQKSIVEGGYQFTTLTFPILWALVYQMSTSPFIMAAQSWAMTGYSAPYIRRFIREHNITKVVNLHFLMNRPLYRALKQVKLKDLPAITVVTDPFTAHPLWFFSQFMHMIVFSKRVEKDGKLYLTLYRQRELFGKRNRPAITLLPPILNPKFNKPLPKDEAKALKAHYGFDPARRLILIAGGGEGLPRGEEYLEAVRKAGLDVDIAMVCGKNQALQDKAIKIAKIYRTQDQVTKVYGFVDFMYDLMNMADAVVTKAGPATIFECLMLQKPLIITQRLYGQEQGNVDYVVKNQLGWFIPKPDRMVEVLSALLDNPEQFGEIRQRIKDRNIQNGTSAITDFILSR